MSVFQRFVAHEGKVPEGYYVNFLGAKHRREYGVANERQQTDSAYPRPDCEDFFEWIDVLEGAIASTGTYTFFELGAGFGRWSVNAAFAAMQLGKDYRILAAEPEPTHYGWLKENLADNGLDMERCRTVFGAVAPERGHAAFYAGNPAGWYGQNMTTWWKALVNRKTMGKGVSLVRVPKVTLADLLESYSSVDLIDMDIQFAELGVLEATRGRLGKVRRIHVGTHSHEIEGGLRKLFGGLGWSCLRDIECTGRRKTEFGLIDFVDGVQTWLNPDART